MLKVGDTAPDFAVGNTTLHRILEERIAVVFFYPGAFTPGCTREARGFGEEFERLAAAGAQIVGVSTDEQEKNDRFRESLRLPYPLVGDPDGTIVKAYDAKMPLLGIARRVTYVIGKDKRIQSAYKSDLRAESHVGQACSLVAPKPSA